MNNDITITLISQSVSDETTADGDPIINEQRQTVFAKILGVSRNEFYQAQALGLRPQIIFSIFEWEYNGEKIVEWNGNKYNVIRTYPVKCSERLELVCNDIAGVG